MADTTSDTFDFAHTYVHLSDGPVARRIEVGPDFWETIDTRTDMNGGRLVAVFPHTADWPHWEMHPDGDEIVYVLSGAVDFILDEADGERTVSLRGRAAVVVPQGVWHRAVVHEAGDALYITRGEGTQHRPV